LEPRLNAIGWWNQYSRSHQWAELIRKGPFVSPKGRLYGFTANNYNVFREYVRNGGNRVKAIMDSSEIKHKSLRGVHETANKLFSTPQARAMIQVMMGQQNIQKAIETTVSGMEATTLKTNKGVECPDWPARLRASETILKIMGAFDKNKFHRDREGNVVEEDAIDVDWTGIHPEIVKYFARFGVWPGKKVEKQLLDEELTTEDIDGHTGE
jgi:hypothetical protein